MTETVTEAGTTTTDAGEPTTAEATAAQTAAAPADTQATDTTKTEGDKPAEPQVPEAYDLQMPEGIELDKAAAEEFTAIAKEHKLTQEQAQKFADIAVKMQQRQVEQHEKLVQGWVEQTKTDKDIGGDKLEENLATARKALDAFGDADLKAMLNSTGFGNHPAIIRAFVKAGKAISEDRFVTGSPKGATDDVASKMFPTMKS